MCTTWGIKGGHIYLLHVFRERLDYPDLKRKVVEHASAHRATQVLIEAQASGEQLIQELIRAGLLTVRRIKVQGDKVMRMRAQTAAIEYGQVLFPEEAPWLDAYLSELLKFPYAKHDDQVDSTSQALKWLVDRQKTTGMLQHMHNELVKAGLPIPTVPTF